ncbi:MAG: 3-dehydroquinate synthase [Clostridiales bacterium]|nr:3-dehydroquinate synthase [Clostridiales bacterium]
MTQLKIISAESAQESVITCEKGAFARAKGDMVFTDSNVYALYKSEIDALSLPVYVMEAGEEHKNQSTLFALLSAMADAGLHRKDTLVCVGGGVVGDIGGLAAALYMRGIGCVQVPTTLLSQVDSSVGGKTAIDLGDIKNLVGVFRQPREVLVDATFLKTLPPREIKCGLGEIVKHGALSAPLFDRLIGNKDRLFDLAFLEEIVPENIAFKADVVQKDAHERNLRKCLNMGHTTGHALELYEKTRSHGEYVLIGMLYEIELAKAKINCDEEYLEKLQSLIYEVLGAGRLPSAYEAAKFARLDKKNNSVDKISIVAPVKKGQYALLEFDYDEYVELLKIAGGKLA